MSNEVKELLKDQSIFCVVDSDTDGTGCRVILEHYVEPEAKSFDLKQTNSGDPEAGINWDYALSQFDVLLFADLGITPERYEDLLARGKQVLLFDHHETTRLELADYLVPGESGWFQHYYYDLERCSAKILFDVLTEGRRKNPVMDQYIHLVNTYDLWKSNSQDFDRAQDLNHLLWAEMFSNGLARQEQGRNSFVRRQLMKVEKYPEFDFSEGEQKMIDKRRAKEAELFAQAKKTLDIRTDLSGRKFGFIEIGAQISTIASMILEEYSDLKYVLVFSTFSPKDGKFSLRSRSPEVKVNDMASTLGGGGHAQAAGFNLNESETKQMREGKLVPDHNLKYVDDRKKT
jgi:oligoribonuclease NrnB/cAMP/cGMP phosphodiesterase (DHH superfamily)